MSENTLRRDDLDSDPLAQFRLWWDAAQTADLPEPSAMYVATSSGDGAPSLRTVLLREFGPGGFVFYTHYRSRKARELEENPRVALLFYWDRLGRQVRIEGAARRVSRERTEQYFRTRSLRSRLGAWTSQQSEVCTGRGELEAELAAVSARFGIGPEDREGDVPPPPDWGGYEIAPETYEFWVARRDRLHDRFVYRRVAGHEDWVIDRLWP